MTTIVLDAETTATDIATESGEVVDLVVTDEFGVELAPFQDELLRRARDFAYSLMSIDAEDLVQTVVMKAAQRSEQSRRGSNVRAWAHTILENAAKDAADLKIYRNEMIIEGA
jgi:hypothetical protein